MEFFANLAYGVSLGSFPMIAIVGFATYLVIFVTILLGSGKRWSRWLRRVPMRVHGGLGILALILATLHLLMGLSSYV